ncbi:hypothetical protein RclHR1_04690021 [Rhizophagus clarus]|uniref:MIR domain-containing protein n=1 Tax=Rhizophagus clarus TaxID=94130 RepID=A0A2Z6S091_9GLOM|nr:hypothetical protein RclHR1_04690021 [Rhizophagus clarus]GES95039.1 hypothetical protein GLOIN_2v1767369 [Rhizophagus clarus]
MSKYNGNIHPDEWINDIKRHLRLKYINYTNNDHLEIAKTLVDTNILLPTGIDSFEKLRNALKEDISFKIFKNTNKRKLQSLKYFHEGRGGDTSRFISNFLKLCYNAEVNDIEEQKNYLFKSLSMSYYFSKEFYKKMINVNSVNELIEEFEDIVVEESNLIKNESIVALKHVATGRYLSSIKDLNYQAGVWSQLIFAGNPAPDPYSLWKIKFDRELAAYANNSIKLQHVKSNNKFLGIGCRNKSPSTNYTEVSCNNINNVGYDHYWNEDWKFNHSKLENHQGYLKSDDIINLSIKKKLYDRGYYTQDGPVEFLRSHEIQFTIEKETFQEVVCHNERLGGNDEWCIELIKQYTWTFA